MNDYKMLINQELINSLDIKWKYKTYNSNIWNILVPENWCFVYKIYKDNELFHKELKFYQIFSQENINIPWYEAIAKNWVNILKLENIRINKKRFNNFEGIDIPDIMEVINKIHSLNSTKYFDNNAKQNIIWWDIHFSNFFLNEKWLWIFDFSSCRLWNIEEDLAWIFIELDCNENKLISYLQYYNRNYELKLIYKYAIIKLYEILKNWKNLLPERIVNYKKYILELKIRYDRNNYEN